MPRARAILQSEFPYSITARCINREWFNIPMDDVWTIFSEELARACCDHNLRIHVFVLMSNHFHLIASTPDANISTCMQSFMQKTSRRLTRRGNRINQTFAGRHYKCVVQTTNYYLNAYKYVYRNPVSAGLCQFVEDYPYSSIRAFTHDAKLKFPVVEDTTWTSDPDGTLAWLNRAPSEKRREAMRCGLRRAYFRSAKSNSTDNLIIGENELI